VREDGRKNNPRDNAPLPVAAGGDPPCDLPAEHLRHKERGGSEAAPEPVVSSGVPDHPSPDPSAPPGEAPGAAGARLARGYRWHPPWGSGCDGPGPSSCPYSRERVELRLLEPPRPCPGAVGAWLRILKNQNEFLKGQLEAERGASAELRRIVAGLVQRIPELEAPQRSPDGPQTDGDGTGGVGHPDTEGAQEAAQPRPERSWWRRWFGFE
jgi:hypothetical protein